jgi:hypothetical protein
VQILAKRLIGSLELWIPYGAAYDDLQRSEAGNYQRLEATGF